MVNYLFIVKGFGYREAATSVAAGRAAWSWRAVPNTPRNNIVATTSQLLNFAQSTPARWRHRPASLTCDCMPTTIIM
jgi:hypothetical protein